MGKSSNHKAENTFRFQTFSERIANVNIDVIHQIKRHDDTPGEESTYFGEALERLSELNCTDHFTSFRREISEQVKTFAHLVHHETEIVEALKKHLLVPNSMALPALLDLVVQLARDLQMNFYRHFKDFFDIFVQLLNIYTQDVEILEHTFTSLSFVFKFLWRYLVQDIEVVYGYFSSLLSQQCKEYVRNFAAESFAFLMRKVKDKSDLFDLMFATLKQDQDKYEGIGQLMFEMMKGVKEQFHSCLPKVLPILLQKLGPQEKQLPDMLPWQQVEETLAVTLISMEQHSNIDNMSEVWEIFLGAVSDVLKKSQNSNKKKSYNASLILERLLRLGKSMVEFRNGALISHPDVMGKVLLNLLNCHNLPTSIGQVLLQMVSALLLTSHTKLQVETTSKIISMVFKTKYPVKEIYSFTMSLFHLGLFEKDVLPSLLPYCQSSMARDNDSRNLSLILITQLLTNKCPPLVDGSQLNLVQTYMLDFGVSEADINFASFILSLIPKHTLSSGDPVIETELEETGLSLVDGLEGKTKLAGSWMAFVCLPHIKSLTNASDVVERVALFVREQLQGLKGNTTQSFILCQALIAIIRMLKSKQVFKHIPADIVINCLKNNHCDSNILRLADIYFTHAVNEGFSDILETNVFLQIFPVLQENLSSHMTVVRRLSVRILSSFVLHLPSPDLDLQNVFSVCNDAETTPSTVSEYRDKLRHLNKLEFSSVQACIPVAGSLHQVPLRYLIGSLHINFKLLWEPIISLIASHAQGMDRNAFWEVYGKYLQFAADKAAKDLQSTDDDGGTVTDGEMSDNNDEMLLLFRQAQMDIEDKNSTDFRIFRDHLWKAMHQFTDKCETQSHVVVPLFLSFLNSEYYMADISTAPTQNLLRCSKMHGLQQVEHRHVLGQKKADLENVQSPMLDLDRGSTEKSPANSIRGCESLVEDEMTETAEPITRRTRSQNKEKDPKAPRSHLEASKNSEMKSDVIYAESLNGGQNKTRLICPAGNNIKVNVDSQKQHEIKKNNGEINAGNKSTFGIGKNKKAVTNSLIVHLQLFAKFREPKSIHMEQKLRGIYNELLIHKNSDVQRLAFQCIMTFKSKYLVPYRENFERLLDDKTFKNEIVLFSIDHENSTICLEHRQHVLPVLMRVLYGKMHVKTGKGTSGKQYSGVRQSIVYRFLSGCHQEELKWFIDLVITPFHEFVTENQYRMVKNVLDNSDLSKIIPLKKVLGALNSVSMIIKKLGHLLDTFLVSLLQIILGMASLSSFCLENRNQLPHYVLPPLKSIRQSSVYLIIQVLEEFDEYRWGCVEIDALFEAIVWPQLGKLSYEGLYTPTPLLKFLHCCSKNPRYFSLLAKHHEDDVNLTPLVQVMKLLFSKDVSVAVATYIMEIVDNLLMQTCEGEQEVKVIDINNMLVLSSTDAVKEGDIGTRLLLPHIPDILKHIEKIVCKLHTQISKKQETYTELNILSRISCFVTDERTCITLVNLLLPFLGKKVSRSLKTEEDILCSIQNLLKLIEDRKQFLPAISKLFSTLVHRKSRTILSDAFLVVCEKYDDLRNLATVVCQLNSWDRRRMEEPDYMLRLEGYRSAVSLVKGTATIDVNICLALVYNCCFFISTVEDMSLRDNSTHCLVTIITHFREVTHDVTIYNQVISSGLLPYLKLGLRSKIETVRHEFITVLISLVETFGDQCRFAELKAIRDKDIDADFYENIKHIQIHKRCRAVRRLIKHLTTVKVSNDTLLSYFLPIVSSFLNDDIYRKHSGLQEAAVEAIGVICRQLPWKHYLHQLKYYLQLVVKKLDIQKLLVRVIVSVLDAFHFDLVNSKCDMKLTPEVTTEVTEQAEESSNTHLNPDTIAEDADVPEINEAEDEMVEDFHKVKQPCSQALATKIHQVVLNSVVGQLHKILVQKVRSEDEHKSARSGFAEDDEILRVPIALAVVKLLQNLPKGALEKHLPGILLKVCNFLKSRSNDIRNTARATLVQIQKTLGPRFFPFILSELRGTLKRGYQRHVLCFTLHLLLKNMEETVKPGDIDVCLNSLQEVFNEEIFGEVSEEKEVEGIVSKVFEARTSKSYESYELISRYINKGSLMTLVEPLKQVLDTTNSHKAAKKVQDVLKKVVHGLMENKDMTVETLLVFIHGLVSQTLPSLLEKTDKETSKTSDKPGNRPDSCLLLPEVTPRGGNKPKSNKRTNMHVLVEFGLQLLNMCWKRQKVVGREIIHLQMLDPLIPMMADCLYSKHIRVNSTSLRCLCWLMTFALPSLETNITRIANGMFILLRNYASAGAAKGDNLELVSMLFKAVTVLVRDIKFHKIDDSQLQVLLTFCEEDLHDYNRQSTAFSLLKAILSRKLNVTELHDLMKVVEEMSITADSAHVQRECRHVVLQYMLDYTLGKKLEQHLQFYVQQLTYEMETGRESALEMMATFFSSFPQNLLLEYSGLFFIPLSAALVNDESAKCRKLTALAIKSLLGKLYNNHRSNLFSIAMKWFMDEKLRHRALAAQLCGLFVEVEGAGFEQRLREVLPMIEQHLQPGRYDKMEGQSLEHDQDHIIYHMLNTLLKILRQCYCVIADTKWDSSMRSIWEHVQSHLTYPHIWVQLAASQLFGLLFAACQPEHLISMAPKSEGHYLAVDTRNTLRRLSVDLITQLQSELLNQELANQVVKNMIFLTKCAKLLDVMSKNEASLDDQSKTFSVVWLVRKMTREAHHEAIHVTKCPIKRTHVFKWMAAVSLDLGETVLPSVLGIMLPALQREINDETTTQDPALKSLAQEVVSMLKKVVSIEQFTDVYITTQKLHSDRKDDRKRKRAFEAVANPEIVAKRKLKKNLAKKESKKRHIAEMKPSKKSKKKKYENFTVTE